MGPVQLTRVIENVKQYDKPQPQKAVLEFGDGFRFGCGFFVAGLVYSVVMLAVVGFLMLLVGGGLLGGLLGLAGAGA